MATKTERGHMVAKESAAKVTPVIGCTRVCKEKRRERERERGGDRDRETGREREREIERGNVRQENPVSAKLLSVCSERCGVLCWNDKNRQGKKMS